MVEFADNSVKGVMKTLRAELYKLYPEMEADSMIYLAFDHYSNLSRTDMVARNSREIGEEELVAYGHLLEQLLQYRPIQHILGQAEFFCLKFNVNGDALIPRQETEELVDWIIKDAGQAEVSILDIGTGSGCIAIALKKYLENAEVTATDVSGSALAVARDNAIRNNVDVRLVQHDILKGSDGLAGKFDIIVSNPPYILKEDMSQLDKTVVDYEPHVALFASTSDALLFYQRIAGFAKHQLSSSGTLYFEINESKGAAVVDLLHGNGFKEIELRQDINGKDRMVKATKG